MRLASVWQMSGTAMAPGSVNPAGIARRALQPPGGCGYLWNGVLNGIARDLWGIGHGKAARTSRGWHWPGGV